MFTTDTSILFFILFNLLTIFVVGIFYFVSKEVYRIRGGNLGKLGITIMGSVLGILIVSIFFALRMNVSADLGPIPLSEMHDTLYAQMILTPSIVIIAVFAVMIDNRLSIPMFIFLLIGYTINTINYLGINELDISNNEIWIRIVFDYIEYLILSILVFFIPTIEFIKKNGIKILVVIIVMVIVGVIVDIVYFAAISTSINPEIFTPDIEASLISIKFGYLVLYAILQSAVILLIEKVYSNFNALETFSTKDDVSYYKMSLAQNSLARMIDEEKINIGILILFQIKAPSEKRESVILEKIKVFTENNYSNAFYFKASASYYGAFFKLSDDYNLSETLKNNKKETRTEQDELYNLTRVLSELENTDNAKITASGSIYGIHSYSVTELIEHARFLMSPTVQRSNNNILTVYDYSRVKQRLSETSQVRNLPIDIESVSISFLRGLSSEDVFYPNISFKEFDNNMSEVLSMDEMKSDQLDIFLRHTAYQTLRKFKEKKANIVIFYSTYHLSSENFNISDFVKKVTRYHKTENVIIGINTKQGSMGAKFNSNVKKLRKEGFRFAIINPATANQKENDKISPEFILDAFVNANPLKIKRVKLEFKTDAILLNPNLTN